MRMISSGFNAAPISALNLPSKADGKARERLTSWNILLVGKDEQQGARHLAILDDARELGARLIHALAVRRVDDEDEALGACAPPMLEYIYEEMEAKGVQRRAAPEK
jgi:hypothetical protein